MEQLAVFTAFTAALLLAANALPTNITDHSSQLTDDAPTELHSINQPRSQAKGVFDDSFTYNEKHFIYPIYENTKEIEDMMFEVDDSSMEQENNEQYRNKRNAVSYLWPGGIIPYVITPDFDAQEKRIILQAMRHWEENTCIRFRPRVSESYYIQIRTSSPGDCRSYLGRTRIRPQPLFLGPNCVRISTVVHELGHAIGFYHEHSRVDRDEYISIFENNIYPGITGAFGKDSGNTLGLGYDYASIMHYSSRAFSRDGRSETIRAKQPNIPIGEAEELSPLDILKANKLYNCRCPLSPPNTVVPPALPPVRPSGVTCGTVEVLRGGETRTVQSPRYPSHVRNLKCAWVFECASGFLPQIEFPSLNLESSSGCAKDYAQLYYGLSLDSQDIIRYGGLTDGRICGNRYSRTRFFASTNIITTFYRTDNSGGSTGLQVKITCIDENECQNARCDNCRNTPGSFECSCNKGYYFSKAATTCYDVNECAYENGGCQHICVNMGGSYRCLCPSGQYVQSDGKRCGTRRPSFSTLPIAPKLPSSCPVTSPPTTTTPPPTTTTPPPTTTTPPPTTTTPPPTTTTPPPPRCGGVLTTASGSFQTPSWPNTYPLTNFHCQWICRLPSTGCQILLRFDDSAFGIAGKTSENCPKDHLRIYDNRGRLVKRICGNAVPSPILTTDNSRILFVAGPDHGPLHKGFRIEYREICPATPPPTVATTTPRPTTRPTSRPTTRPTTLPPTITPPSLCGGRLRGASGDLQTPAWPQTYPLNFDCEWNIQVPSPGCNVRLTFDGLAFGIAGKTTENCPRDYLKIHDNNGLIHTICDLGRPSLITTTGNTRLYFHAGPYHGPKRKGFKIYYTIVCPTTPPPTTRPTTVATTTPDPTTPPPTTRPTTVATTVPATRPTTTTPPTTLAPTTLPPPTPNCPVLPVNPQGNFVCGGFMRPGDSFGPANLPSGPIPNKISCQWVVFNTVTSQFKVSFKYFDIPSSEECSSNSVAVYDGYGTRAPLIEKICGEKCDEYIVEGTGYIMTVVLKVSSPGSFRGFFATFTEQ